MAEYNFNHVHYLSYFYLGFFLLCRHEFYQKPEEVVVTVFAKGIPAKNVVVDFGEQIVSPARSLIFAMFYMNSLRLTFTDFSNHFVLD